MDKIQLTTKDDDYPIIYRVLTIPGGAGFRPWHYHDITCPLKLARSPEELERHEEQLHRKPHQVALGKSVGT